MPSPMPAIYYLTRFTDLPSILKAGALISSSGSEQGSPGSSPLLWGEAIRQRRQMRRVENLQGRSVAAGGVVADYVSFRFTHRSGYLDAIAVPDLRAFETELYASIESRYPQLFPAIAEKKTLDDALKASLNTAVKEFATEFAARKAAAA